VHEMSLAEGVIQLLEDSAVKNDFRRVKTVWLEIGQLAGVEAEAMRFCFDAVTRGSIAEGATLEIIETPGQGRCFDCNREVTVTARYEPCPLCGGYGVEVSGGTEMRVKELEVE
jgi:hydrogenase nickel incorporation protein HypA/HybF